MSVLAAPFPLDSPLPPPSLFDLPDEVFVHVVVPFLDLRSILCSMPLVCSQFYDSVTNENTSKVLALRVWHAARFSIPFVEPERERSNTTKVPPRLTIEDVRARENESGRGWYDTLRLLISTSLRSDSLWELWYDVQLEPNFLHRVVRRNSDDGSLTTSYRSYLVDSLWERGVHCISAIFYLVRDDGEDWKFDGLLGICPAEEVTLDSRKCYQSPSSLRACESANCVGSTDIGGWGLWLEDPDRIVTYYENRHGDVHKSVARPLREGDNHVLMIVDLDQGHLFYVINGHNYGLAFGSIKGPVFPGITTHHQEETWTILGVY